MSGRFHRAKHFRFGRLHTLALKEGGRAEAFVSERNCFVVLKAARLLCKIKIALGNISKFV